MSMIAYLYSPITMDVTRKQLTNMEPGKGIGGPMNTFANVPAYPTADILVDASAELRYALFQRMARSYQGARDRLCPRHGRTILSPADARYVDGRVRVAWLADHGNASGQLHHRAAGMAARI